MAWSSPDSWLTRLLSGDPVAILISLLFAIALPALLHWSLYTASPKAQLTPTILLLGPSGSGKTSLVSLLQNRSSEPSPSSSSSSASGSPTQTSNGTTTQTRTSQISSTTTLHLSSSITLGSNKYRSQHDAEVSESHQTSTPYKIIDTPGHGKLRTEHSLTHLSNPSLRGVLFLVDSAALDTDTATADPTSSEDATREAAIYLHDALLTLQKRRGKKQDEIGLLIAANKQDLFTALPPGTIKSKLQEEIEKVRRSRARGIRSVDREVDAEEEEDDVLGGAGEEKFSFKLLEEEFGVVVEVAGGAVRGEEAGKGVKAWEEWIGGCL